MIILNFSESLCFIPRIPQCEKTWEPSFTLELASETPTGQRNKLMQRQGNGCMLLHIVDSLPRGLHGA